MKEHPIFYLGAGTTLDLSPSGIDKKYIHGLMAFTPVITDSAALSIQTLILFNLDDILLRIPVVGHLSILEFVGGGLSCFFGAGVCIDFPYSAVYGFLKSGLEIRLDRGLILEIGGNATPFSADGIDLEIFGSIAFFF